MTGADGPPVTGTKAVLWDLGGVLLDWDPRHLYRKLFGADVAAMDDFLAHVCSPAWHAQQDLGRATAEACAELAAEHPGQAEMINAWAVDLPKSCCSCQAGLQTSARKSSMAATSAPKSLR